VHITETYLWYLGQCNKTNDGASLSATDLGIDLHSCDYFTLQFSVWLQEL